MKATQSLLKSPGKVVLSLLLGLLTAWLLRGEVTMLLLGKDFAGRSLPVQAALLGTSALAAALLWAVFLHFSGIKPETFLLGRWVRLPGPQAELEKKVIALGALVLISLFLLSNTFEQQVEFADSQLEEVVREMIGKPHGDIYERDLLTLASLDASGRDIARLEGIESLRNLVDLNLENNRISNIQPLAMLHRLDKLNLRDNDIEDLSPLKRLTGLIYLNLHSNRSIRSLKPLENITGLETLILRNVPVGEDVQLLGKFTVLRRLNVRNCGLTDIAVFGELMAGGALQDQPAAGIKSFLDLRDNPIPYKSNDGYAPIRSYWDNINDRVPLVLPYYASLEAPLFSHSGGFYKDPFWLQLSANQDGGAIHFTLDGSDPTIDSLVYEGPLLISSRSGEPNQLSAILDTAPGWQGPAGEVFKATVVKAKVFDSENNHYSATVTHTYFEGEDVAARYKLPIVAITTNPDFLFDYKNGIYVMGKVWDDNYDPVTYLPRTHPANYRETGSRWERPVHIEIFENSGFRSLSQNAGIRIHGGVTRSYPSKSLRIYARSEYDTNESFYYPLFPGLKDAAGNQAKEEFKTWLLRNSGNDFHQTMFRDALVQSLVSHTTLDTSAYRPVIVFINGEYWGIQNMRERFDEYYLANTYSLDPDQVVILEMDSRLRTGVPGDESHYQGLLDYIEQNDISEAGHYAFVLSRMDIDNFIDYQVTEIFARNTDWPHTNIYYWRLKTGEYRPDASPGSDGRWRWMLYDTDHGFGWGSENDSHTHNTLEHALSPDWSGFLLRSLLQNPEFRIQFINRFADHMNSSFDPQRVIGVIDDMQAALEPDMAEHILRWQTMEGSMDVWKQNIEVMRTFARQRPGYVRQHITDHFGLSGTAPVRLDCDPVRGYIQINSIAIKAETPGVQNPASWTGVYFNGVPVNITAVAKPGFRFAGWDEGVGDDPELTLLLSGDVALRANFEIDTSQ